jgi:hypothetical protein
VYWTTTGRNKHTESRRNRAEEPKSRRAEEPKFFFFFLVREPGRSVNWQR